MELIEDIKEYLPEGEPSNSSNSLECICLLITGKEFQNNFYTHFKNQIYSKAASVNPLGKKIDFKVLIKEENKLLIDQICLDSCFNEFNSLDLIFSSVPKKYDFYITQKREELDMTYGLSSGPNYAFFETVKLLKKYNTTLFLECDCFLSENWLERVYNYVLHSGGFWISGATYDGKNDFVNSTQYNSHINGGVCLYKTGDGFFQGLLNYLFHMFPMYIKKYTENLPYDFYLKYAIEYHYDHDKNNREFWQFVKRQYLKTNLITNYTAPEDTRANVNEILNKHNCAIIHKKPF